MNDSDNFLKRWSRRKREVGGQPGEETKASPVRHDSAEAVTPPAGEEKSPQSPTSVSPTSATDFDTSSLPPIDAIGADTDISVFMEKGVPTKLRHAALRRAWSADPAIRDFMGPTENYWDAAGPEGVPGFGDLDPGLDVKRLVSELFGEIEPEKAKLETSEPASASGPSAEIPETPPQGDDGQPQRIENVAPQQRVSGSTPATHSSVPAAKIARRHGSAMPE
jgi:hypothetical protein